MFGLFPLPDSLAPSITARAPETIRIIDEPICPGRISPMQYGQFMEYLCDLFPGMWSEKLDDGGFEGLTPFKFAFVRETDFKQHPWYPSGEVNSGEYSLDKGDVVNGETCQRISTSTKSTLGISQAGLVLDPTEPCKFSIWMRSKGTTGPVNVLLKDRSTIIGRFETAVSGEWKKYSTRLTPLAKSDHATITIQFTGPGSLWLDAASLMPVKSAGGWRPDVVRALRKLKPSVIRLGGSVMDDPNLGAFEWQDTVGDPDRRKPFRAWGGLQQTGPGIEEFVQLCQRVDAEPLICIRVRGKTPHDAANEVAYFNAPTSTEMGALRAKNGHPEPYNVKYWQVGNEQGGEGYESSLRDYCQAIRAVDPSVKILSSFPSEAVLDKAGDLLDYTCPHQYDCANLQSERDELNSVRGMIAKHSPNHPIKVGVTEWNTTAGDMGLKRAGLWDLANALYCSRYQNLLHRNCDLVEIANRSNLTNSFCSGVIQTDKQGMYLTPTYYAQMLYSNLAGTRPIKVDPPAPIGPGLDISATLSEDGSTLTVFAVNNSLDDLVRTIELPRSSPWTNRIKRWVLHDTLNALDPNVANNFETPERVGVSRAQLVRPSGDLYTFAPLSLTVLQFSKG